MRAQGFDLLERNAVLGEEIRRTFPEIDRMEKELGKAAKAIQSVSALVVRYRERLRELCDTVAAPKRRRRAGAGWRHRSFSGIGKTRERRLS